MATLQSLDIRRRSASNEAPPQIRQQGDGSRQADRCLQVHRLQGLPGGVPGVERSQAGDRLHRRHLQQPDRPDAGLVDRDALHGIRARRRSRMADPQGRLHALRRPGLPEGLPGAGGDRAVHQRHRRLRVGELHRLRLLREGLPLQRAAHLQGRPQGLQVHALRRPRLGRPGAGLRQGLPDPGDLLRLQGGHDRPCRAADHRPEVARLQERRPLQSAGRRRHARHVRAAPCRQAVALCRPAGRSQDQPDGRVLEGRHEADLAGGDRLRRRVRLPALHHQGPQRGQRSRPTQGRRAGWRPEPRGHS